jgi:hypothetical protein
MIKLRGRRRRADVVESNHDYWIARWLQNADIRKDLTNATAFHRWNLAVHQAIEQGAENFSIFRHVLHEADPSGMEGVNFIPIGSSFEICKDRGGIECGLHGHVGTNGSVRSTQNLTRVAIKINKGHDPRRRLFRRRMCDRSEFAEGAVVALEISHRHLPQRKTDNHHHAR